MPLLLPLDFALPVIAIAALVWLIRARTRPWLAYFIVSLTYMCCAFLIALGQGYSVSIYVIVATADRVRTFIGGRAPQEELNLWESLLVALVGVVVIPTAALLLASFVRNSAHKAREA